MAGFIVAESSGLIQIESLEVLSGPRKTGIASLVLFPESYVQFLPSGEGKISCKSARERVGEELDLVPSAAYVTKCCISSPSGSKMQKKKKKKR